MRNFSEHGFKHAQHLGFLPRGGGSLGNLLHRARHADGHEREQREGEDDFEQGETRRMGDCAGVFHPLT